MKFTDGYWMLREGVSASYPVEVLDVDHRAGLASASYAPTQPIRHRGDLLKGPVVTLTYSSPMPDVIGVTITHFAGEEPREPRFSCTRRTSRRGRRTCDDEAAVLTSGALSVRVGRTGPWRVEFPAERPAA